MLNNLKDAEWYQNKLLLKKGLDVGPIEIMLHVRLLEGIESGEHGDKTKVRIRLSLSFSHLIIFQEICDYRDAVAPTTTQAHHVLMS
jgi:hypothetical protein